jgi:hypothetical protein
VGWSCFFGFGSVFVEIQSPLGVALNQGKTKFKEFLQLYAGKAIYQLPFIFKIILKEKNTFHYGHKGK